MTITIEEPKREGLNRQLKMKNIAPFEYAVIEKEFPEPMSGTSQFGTWYNFGVKVHEYHTLDPKTGDKKTEKPDESVAFFPSPKCSEKLKNHPVGVKLKVTAEQIEGKKGTYPQYNVEVLENVTEEASNTNSAPHKSVEERIKLLKDQGIDRQTVINTLKHEFDINDALIGAKYDAL